MLTALFVLVACKKDVEPEVATEAVDAATSVTVHVPEGTNKVRLVCKDGGADAVFDVTGDTVLVQGVVGDQCQLTFQPLGKKWGPVEGGTTVVCIDDSAGDKAACKVK